MDEYKESNEYKYLRTIEYLGSTIDGIPQITCPNCNHSDSLLLCSAKLVQRLECEFIEFNCPICHEEVKSYTEGMWANS